MKNLSLSIVIPVYNEQQYLGDCLRAIAAQAAPPDEVIVVDNNSTDDSLKIAARFPFVKILHEYRQGQIFAQATGFDKASGAILARIDGDSLLPPDWVQKVKHVFSQSEKIVAITGEPKPYDALFKHLSAAVFRFYHQKVGPIFAGQVLLWGANMAIKAKWWPAVKARMTFAPDIWEDFELSFLIAKYGQVKYVRGLKVGCSFRSGYKPLGDQINYHFRAVRTVRRHVNRTRAIAFFIAWSTLFVVFPFTLIDRYLWRNQSS